jgi:hypothetical protein
MCRAAVTPVSRWPRVVLGKSTFERHFYSTNRQASVFCARAQTCWLSNAASQRLDIFSVARIHRCGCVWAPPFLGKGANLEANMKLCSPLDVSKRFNLPARCPLQTGRSGYRGTCVP